MKQMWSVETTLDLFCRGECFCPKIFTTAANRHWVEPEMAAHSSLATDFSGTIRVVPAYGKKTVDYLPKLARCYMENLAPEHGAWGGRLKQLIENLEVRESPDVVLLDSRAGIHDIAAVLVTRMEAATFLFAVDSAQAWNAYAFLFRHWRTSFQNPAFRNRLQIVAGLVPETERNVHLDRFRTNSWDLFQEKYI